MSSKALQQPASVDPPPSSAALDRVLRYLLEEMGPQQGPTGAGLDRARALLAALGDPQDRYPAVHVAGTAGKGSVSVFVASLLRAHGFQVGAHLSPHAYCLLERFQMDGGPAPAELVDAELQRIRPAVAAVERAGHGRPSFFEVTNAIAFSLFAGRVDYGVIETGVGGLLDSTNTIARADKLAVITPIGLDHQELLGTTVAEIARQKAGIFPVGGRAVAARPRSAEVADVLTAEAARRGCDLGWVDLGPPAVRARTGPDGTDILLRGHPPLRLGLTGRHQAGNARLALRAVEAIAARDAWTVDADAVRLGLRSTTLPGRFERRLIGGRTTLLDGAHNPMKLAALVATLQEVYPGARLPWVLALKQGKDLHAALEVIAPTAALVVATEFATEDGDHPAAASVPATQIAMAARERGLQAVVEEEPACAVTRASQHADLDLPVVVSGSFHLLATVRPGTTAA
ncbi:dihydrofolate synthase / folylpolyglutamate synthase [Blastococcus mobilis]|uniref:tetrahydrofolate synthase n=2 Tax=Blastococcus mobilis TaxID=1938746 RepID=A0A238WVZ5_9ACTN|nr:dihydrofolate synthase / folylpolyglutamate synthase [Blastococcus mobilis]